MTKFFFYITLASFAIFAACSQNELENDVAQSTFEAQVIEDTSDALNSDFTIDNYNSAVFEKDNLLLTNNSANAVYYHWDFGNGDTSTEANPTYAYDHHGIFTVKLTIADQFGNTEVSSNEITVICLFDGEDHDSN